MHDSLTIADRFLSLAAKRNAALTPMQLLKLVYIAHGWMYGLHGRPLVKDPIQAWQYGPVIPRLYDAIKHHRGQPVRAPLRKEAPQRLEDDEESIIQQVYGIYGGMSGPALSRLTHRPGTPWAQTYEPESFGLEIAPDLIEAHYRQLALAARATA